MSGQNDESRPRVHICWVGSAEPEWVQYVEHGIEEESVAWVVTPVDSGDDADSNSVKIAHGAALDSALKVGVSVAEDRIVVHHKQLDTESPVFDHTELTPNIARRLGSNAARLAKGTPLRSVER